MANTADASLRLQQLQSLPPGSQRRSGNSFVRRKLSARHHHKPVTLHRPLSGTRLQLPGITMRARVAVMAGGHGHMVQQPSER
jgi:hypothetical protein